MRPPLPQHPACPCGGEITQVTRSSWRAYGNGNARAWARQKEARRGGAGAERERGATQRPTTYSAKYMMIMSFRTNASCRDMGVTTTSTPLRVRASRGLVPRGVGAVSSCTGAHRGQPAAGTRRGEGGHATQGGGGAVSGAGTPTPHTPQTRVPHHPPPNTTSTKQPAPWLALPYCCGGASWRPRAALRVQRYPRRPPRGAPWRTGRRAAPAATRPRCGFGTPGTVP